MSIYEKLTANPAKELKQKCQEINQVMLTHLEGVCPDYIFKQRRPLEAKSDYAIDHRRDNFRPVTKSPFDKAVSAISEISTFANLALSNVLDETKKQEIEVIYNDEEIDLFEFCLNRLTRVREIDCNGYIIDYPAPQIEPSYLSNTENFDIEFTTIFVSIEDFISYKKGVFIGNIGNWEYADGKFEPYRIIISKLQTAISIPVVDGNTFKYKDVPVYLNNLYFSPIIPVSKNFYTCKKMKYALPYLWGAAAWGDKFYGEMTDFDIKMLRFTYPHTIKAALDCTEPGMEMRKGRHYDPITNRPCTTCKGTGTVYPEETPLGATYIKWDKFTTENGTNVPIIKFEEPSQAGIQTSERIIDKYYDLMSVELGLMKQNLTATSGESKSYDEKTRISMYTAIVMDNIRVAEAIMNVRQDYLYNFNMAEIPTIKIDVIGELNIKTNDELLAELGTAVNAHPAIKVALTKKILLKQLGDNELTRRVVELASDYDVLFPYGANDLASVRAQMGSVVTEKKVMIHNTVVDQIIKALKDPTITDEVVITKLDNYYSRFDVLNPSMPNILN